MHIPRVLALRTAFLPESVFMCLVWLSQLTAIMYSCKHINWMACLLEGMGLVQTFNRKTWKGWKDDVKMDRRENACR
jgi:hypothetical protein